MHAHAAARGDVKRPVRTGSSAAGALGERGRPSGDSHGAQQISVQHEFPRVAAVGHRPQRTDRQPVQRGHRSAFLSRQPFRGFQHGARTGVAAVVADDVGCERVDGLHLGDDVQIAARV